MDRFQQVGSSENLSGVQCMYLDLYPIALGSFDSAEELGDYFLGILCCILLFFSGVQAQRMQRKVVNQKEWCSKGFQLPIRQLLGLSIQFY